MNPTSEQRSFINHPSGAFIEACPGAGKTATIVARIASIAPTLPPRRGLAVLSFTNSAIDEFRTRCHALDLDCVLRHPGFVGTFDSFLRQFLFAPGGIEGVLVPPTVLDSWRTLAVEIRLRGGSAFRGAGAGLDLFDAETGEIDPASIGHGGLRAHVHANRAAYQQAAIRHRRAMREKGYVSAADVRVEVLRRLQRANWAACLGRAIAARFHEVIIDEAQDCNHLDLQIIHWLRNTGVSVTLVADPDQAIYEFRNGNPTGLRGMIDTYGIGDRLRLTGNFRSSPAICSVAATLRGRCAPDASLGETSSITEPVHVLAYSGSSIPDRIGRRFCALMAALPIPLVDGIVLAHSRKSALRACGSAADESPGNSNLARVAGAVSIFWSPSASTRFRDSALRAIEKLILELMGVIDGRELPKRAADRERIDTRWLRRSALELVSQVPRICADSTEGRAAWVSAVCSEVQRLNLPCRQGMSVRQYFPTRSDGTWHRLLVVGQPSHIRSSTIHEAKGKAYEGVCVVLPPDTGQRRRTERVFTHWQNRTDDEAKRVVYVGITRARVLCAVAVPVAFKAHVTAILGDAGADFRVHDV